MSFEYLEAAKAVRKVVKGEASSKTAIFSSSARNVKRVYALVTETLKHRDALEGALRSAGLHKRQLDWSLLLVMAFEHFFGAGKIKGGGQVKRELLQCEAAVRAHLGVASIERSKGAGGSAGAERAGRSAQEGGSSEAGERKPRWLRVNTLKASVQDVLSQLTGGAGAGATGSSSSAGQGQGGDDAAQRRALKPEEVVVDPNVTCVLRLPPDAHSRLNLHSHSLVATGAVVLQDLASAMPVAALLQDWRPRSSAAASSSASGAAVEPFDAVDCCAAPGNKSTQLAAAMAAMFHGGAGQKDAGKKRGKGAQDQKQAFTVHAFDRDSKRLALLQSRVQEAGAGHIISASCTDFLSVDVHQPAYSSVRVVVLDPSCSGSGMERPQARRGDAAAEASAGSAAGSAWPPAVPASQAARVRSLAEFQQRALLHALTFPSLQRLVYSTCSVYTQEDEAVVAAALQSFRAARGQGAVKLVKTLPSWHRRGMAGKGLTDADAACCVRCHPQEDGTTGFFLAVLELA